MRDDSRRWLPAAVVALAVTAMAVAGRRTGGLDAGAADGVWKNGRPEMGLLAVIVLVVVATNFAKHRDNGYGLLHRAGTATALLLSAAAVLTPIGLLFFGRQGGPKGPVPGSDGLGTKRPPIFSIKGAARSGRTGKSLADWIAEGVLALLGLAVVALVVYVLFRILSRIRFHRLRVPLIQFEPLGPDVDQLAEAVAAGAEALEYEGDAREAVIACYSAMEQAVSFSGGRRATDTPEEFLRRVTAAKIIPAEPASRLTELFREARFSRHPITEEQRDAAREALRAISEHLRLGAQAQAAATADAKARAAAAAPTAGSA